jgi:uncharacterized protein YjiS (DUF1127 family)
MNDQSAARAAAPRVDRRRRGVALLSAIAAVLSSLFRIVRAIDRRRRRALLIGELMRLDDKTLADIGLHRSEIRSAVVAAEERDGPCERRRCR